MNANRGIPPRAAKTRALMSMQEKPKELPPSLMDRLIKHSRAEVHAVEMGKS